VASYYLVVFKPDPYHGCLRTAVGVQGDKVGQIWSLENLADRIRKWCHVLVIRPESCLTTSTPATTGGCRELVFRQELTWFMGAVTTSDRAKALTPESPDGGESVVRAEALATVICGVFDCVVGYGSFRSPSGRLGSGGVPFRPDGRVRTERGLRGAGSARPSASVGLSKGLVVTKLGRVVTATPSHGSQLSPSACVLADTVPSSGPTKPLRFLVSDPNALCNSYFFRMAPSASGQAAPIVDPPMTVTVTAFPRQRSRPVFSPGTTV
jgi:hypothetical protein